MRVDVVEEAAEAEATKKGGRRVKKDEAPQRNV